MKKENPRKKLKEENIFYINKDNYFKLTSTERKGFFATLKTLKRLYEQGETSITTGKLQKEVMQEHDVGVTVVRSTIYKLWNSYINIRSKGTSNHESARIIRLNEKGKKLIGLIKEKEEKKEVIKTYTCPECKTEDIIQTGDVFCRSCGYEIHWRKE